MERLFRAFWYLTVLIVFFGLMYSFASLPELVQYLEGQASISSDLYFYVTLGVIALSNFALYVLAQKFTTEDTDLTLTNKLQSWLYALNSSLNLFYFVALMFVMMHNSSEKWNFELLGYGLYISIGIVFLCVLSLPVLMFTGKGGED